MFFRRQLAAIAVLLFLPSTQPAYAVELELPENLAVIESNAFAGVSPNHIRFPKTVQTIADDAFDRMSFVGSGEPGSYAEEWCISHGAVFEAEWPSSSIAGQAKNVEGFNFPGLNGYEQNPEGRMAHNIYVDPILSDFSGRYSAFSIDFMAENVPKQTYWSLCNWTMDTSSLRQRYTVTDSGGAYAGLQLTDNGPTGIMSFWGIHYLDSAGSSHILNARRVFPSGDEHYFGGEGEGTNYIGFFDWQPMHWYRMFLRCDDSRGSTTFVEQWIQDLDSLQWTLLSCFDTGLSNSCFVGQMSQFMENYDGNYANEYRSFRYKNIWVKEAETGIWKPVNQTQMSVDTWWDNKKGYYAFCADDTGIWGITCGYGPDVVKTTPNIIKGNTYPVPFSSQPTEPNF